MNSGPRDVQLCLLHERTVRIDIRTPGKHKLGSDKEKLRFTCLSVLKESQLSSTCCASWCASLVLPRTSAAVAAWAPADTSEYALLIQHALRDCNDCGD